MRSLSWKSVIIEIGTNYNKIFALTLASKERKRGELGNGLFLQDSDVTKRRSRGFVSSLILSKQVRTSQSARAKRIFTDVKCKNNQHCFRKVLSNVLIVTKGWPQKSEVNKTLFNSSKVAKSREVFLCHAWVLHHSHKWVFSQHQPCINKLWWLQ